MTIRTSLIKFKYSKYYIPIRVQVESNRASTTVIVAIRETEVRASSIVGTAPVLVRLYLPQRVVTVESQQF